MSTRLGAIRVWKSVLEECMGQVGVGQQGPFVIEEAGVQDASWTLQSSSSDPSSLSREESEARLRGSKAEQAKGLPDRKLVAGFAFIAQGNGYKYTRKSSYDSANRMGQDLSLSSKTIP